MGGHDALDLRSYVPASVLCVCVYVCVCVCVCVVVYCSPFLTLLPVFAPVHLVKLVSCIHLQHIHLIPCYLHRQLQSAKLTPVCLNLSVVYYTSLLL